MSSNWLFVIFFAPAEKTMGSLPAGFAAAAAAGAPAAGLAGDAAGVAAGLVAAGLAGDA